jgi:uncharacterized RDD family membrane protein YckC
MSSSPLGGAPYDPVAGEKLIIETPEQTSIEFPLAGIGSRFLALLIDSLFQIAMIVVLLLILAGVRTALPGIARDQTSNAAVWVAAIVFALFFLIWYCYFTFFEAMWNGQTPGKRLTHIRVIKDSGQPITAFDSVGRNFLRLVDFLPFAYGVGVLTAWISPQSKRLGDYVAGTVVVHEKPLQTVAPQWDAPSQAAAHPYGASRLTAEEFAVVEMFLNRRSALDAAVRYDTAYGIVKRIESKLTIPPERPSPEKLLEEIAYERRSTAGYR